jgi:lipid-binding SYLF domain-containing protein
MRRLSFRVALGMAVVAVALLGVRQAHADDGLLVIHARQTMATFEKTDPSLTAFAASSAGYVVFPTITKGGLGVGGAHGDGVVFMGGNPVGKASMTQVTVGLQAGGQQFAQVIFFQTPGVLQSFMKGQFAFAANASAVAVKAGASASARYENGVAVFTQAEGGLMFEAALGGQKFNYGPLTLKK